MDPTISLIGGPDVKFPESAPRGLTELPNFSPQYDTSTTPENTYADPKLLAEQTKIQDEMERFIDPKKSVNIHDDNPFEGLKRLKYMNRAAVKLGNVDAIFDVTGYRQHFEKTGELSLSAYSDDGFGTLVGAGNQIKRVFTFADIAAAPGAFTQYIMDRRPMSLGYGISLKVDDDALNWNKELIDKAEGRFDVQYGSDGSGNLYTQSDSFIDYVLEKQPDGVNLCTADGGFDISTQLKEIYSVRLVMCQIATALGILGVGGHFVLKIFNTHTSASAQLVALLTLAFKEVYMFKPISSRPINTERYIVCKHLVSRKIASDICDAILDINDDYPEFEPTRPYLKSLFDDSLMSPAFIRWFREHNDMSLRRRIESGNIVLSKLKGVEVEIPRYDLHRAVLYWGLIDRKRPMITITDYPYAWKCYPDRQIIIEQIKSGDMIHLQILPDLYFEELRVRESKNLGDNIMNWWFSSGQHDITSAMNKSRERPTLLAVRTRINNSTRQYPRLVISDLISKPLPKSESVSIKDKYGCGFIWLLSNNFGGDIDIIETRADYIKIYNELIKEFGDPTKHKVVPISKLATLIV